MWQLLWDTAVTAAAAWIVDRLRRFVWGTIKFGRLLWRANSRTHCYFAMGAHTALLQVLIALAETKILRGASLRWTRRVELRMRTRLDAWIGRVQDQPFEPVRRNVPASPR